MNPKSAYFVCLFVLFACLSKGCLFCLPCLLVLFACFVCLFVCLYVCLFALSRSGAGVGVGIFRGSCFLGNPTDSKK